VFGIGSDVCMIALRALREGQMNIPETYDYLVRARPDLWVTLEGVPDDVLSRPLLDGSRFHCIKDLVFHTPVVEVTKTPCATSPCGKPFPP